MHQMTDDDIAEEQAAFANALAAFHHYSRFSLSANNKRRKDYYRLPRSDQALLAGLGYTEKLNTVDDAIMTNARFLLEVVSDPEIFQNQDMGGDPQEPESAGSGTNDSTPQSLASLSHSHGGGGSHSHGHSHSGLHELPNEHSHDQARGSSSHDHSHGAPSRNGPRRPTEFDMDKLRSTLKQFVRDWSTEGAQEREACYKPLEDALLAHYSDIPFEERRNFRILVPGAGLGRLAWNIANLGFASQGNEFSHYMLLCSHFVLNRIDEVEKHTIYPYVHTFSNLPDREAILRPIKIPDVSPSSLPKGSAFSLMAGDFEEIYGENTEGENGTDSEAGKWDAVLTCFFIDTAKNVVNYLKIIHRILAPGGVWINLGPLLWHWENNSTGDPSIELDLKEVKALARKIGFEIKNERMVSTTYTNNARSMLGYQYDAAFWTATKIP